jgi:16S rRNA (guanine527-N7)-methyltransferase
MSSDAAPDLATELAARNIQLGPDQIEQLAEYARRLWDWNTKINLTRHTDFAKFVARDVVDSHELSKAIDAEESIVDVGTGGGVPGIVLAILRPDLRVTLTESIAKKARVVADIVGGMNLPVVVHAGRAEQLLESEYYNSLVARAVAPIVKLVTWFGPHWGAFGRLLVIKGPAWVEERHEARESGRMRHLQLRKLSSWPMEGTDSESVLLEIRPKDNVEAP